ncbi:dsDNA nuclease domain-containing protein [Fusobacterium sp. HC1336]|uniref:dsDNA nuclease domain-containing protein n=1 Tax=Fusobacterium sp. HC1336 TaxID=3171169 RepID=UPI003F21DB41
MNTAISKLENDLINNSFQEDGGTYAIKGFNFQAFSGIYIIFYLEKNNCKYKVTFEKEDDISIINYTTNKNYKIQAKSKSLTLSSILKKDKYNNSILEKLVQNHNGYNFISLIFPEETSKALLKSSKIINESFLEGDTFILDVSESNKDIDNLANILCKYNCTSDKILLKKMPFIDKAENAFRFLLGYAKEDFTKNLNINAGDLYKLLGMIYCISEKKFIFSEITNDLFSKFFRSIEILDEEKEILDSIFDDIKEIESNFIANRIKRLKGCYHSNKEYYNNFIKGIIPKFTKNTNFKNYYEECKKIIKENLDKDILSKIENIEYILIWKVIENVIEEELKSNESSI